MASKAAEAGWESAAVVRIRTNSFQLAIQNGGIPFLRDMVTV